MRALLLMVLIAFAPQAAGAEAAGGPQAAIAGIYKAYQNAPSKGPDLGKVYSARLQALIDADAKATPEGEVGKIDWDVFVDGQEWEIAELKIAVVSEDADRAQVSASFENLGEPREMLFDLVREGGRWLVDDVQSLKPGGRWTMSKILTGAPDAFPDEAD
jgi:hypothetical protein